MTIFRIVIIINDILLVKIIYTDISSLHFAIQRSNLCLHSLLFKKCEYSLQINVIAFLFTNDKNKLRSNKHCVT